MREGPPQISPKEKAPTSHIEVEPEFEDFVPADFMNDPVGYFEREGTNIKTGEIKQYDEGRIREDPTAVKDLPPWTNSKGDQILTVGRRVNVMKGAVGESGDPFYEYHILEQLEQRGLRAAKPIVKVESSGTHIIVMERLPGLRWSELKSSQLLQEHGYSEEDMATLKREAEEKMLALQTAFEAKGVLRRWKLKDMVFQIDFENKTLLNIFPTDWERTRIEPVSE